MKRMIFHIPLKINRERSSASQIRPLKMIEAFKKVGFEVDLVEGYGKERKKQIKKIKKNILDGIEYQFLYSESSTMPTLLTEKHHFPIYPFLDFSFFSFCKKHGIRIGLFYRDIYWCFSIYNHGWRAKIAKYFHQYDLKKYNKLLDVLFLPSLKMQKYLFDFCPQLLTYELPSGTNVIFHDNNMDKTCLEILYVGGIGLGYNLKRMVKCVSEVENVHLTLCCREDDWNEINKEYQAYIADNISVVHLSGNKLEELYKNADLFCLYFEPSEDRTFAAPYKLFEAIGNGCPVLSSPNSWVADFVEKNNIGYVCDYTEEALKSLLSEITLDELKHKRNIIYDVAKNNTWEVRCQTIVDLLKK